MKLIAKDFELARKTLYPYVEKSEQLPITYSIGEKTYQGMPKTAEKSVAQKDGYEEITYSALIDGLSVKTVARKYNDFPAVEWTVYFTNNGNTDSALLHNVKAIDNEFIGEKPTYITNSGDYFSWESYSTFVHDFREEKEITQAPSSGRPCDGAFPYQRLNFENYGYHIAIGWPAQWESKAVKTAHGVHFEAGQQELSSILHPNETLRSPLILLVVYDGELARGINVWRKFYLAHIMPHSDGKIVQPMLVGTFAPDGTSEYTASSEENQLKFLNKAQEWNLPINMWWIDAGWYNCKDKNGNPDWWSTIGDWETDPERFPNTLKPVADKCHSMNTKLYVWYEYLRTTMGAKVVKEHPEWLLYDGELQERSSILLDIGNPACREWLTKIIGDSMEENGVDITSLDFNTEPLPLWKKYDAENRKGSHENLHVQGDLAYLDALKERFPNLIFNTCVSGCRRSDVETMRRAVTFHASDNGYGHHPVLQSYYQVLYSWIPYFSNYNEDWEVEDGSYVKPDYFNTIRVPVDDYQLISCLAPMVTLRKYFFASEMYSDEDFQILQGYSKLFYQVANDLETADFYALTPQHHEREKWTVWQFDVPEENRGLFEVIRNNAAPEETKTVFPFVADGTYVFTDLRTGETFEKTAEEMKKNGLTFAQPKRSAHIWSYVVKS